VTWIESHASLARHPKTIRLAKTLDISVPCAIGHLHLLWWWSLEYAQEGDLSGFDPEEVAEAAGYDGDGEAFVAALQRARFVDDDGQLHDWQDYAGRLIERRQANTERMRAARAQRASSIKAPRAQHVHDTFDARAGATVPNRTVPNRTVPNQSTGADAPPAPKKTREKKAIEPIDDLYLEQLITEFAPLMGGPSAVRHSIQKAMNHATALPRSKDKRLRLRHWLEDDMGKYQPPQERTNGTQQRSDGANEPSRFDQYRDGRELMAEQFRKRDAERADAGDPEPVRASLSGAGDHRGGGSPAAIGAASRLRRVRRARLGSAECADRSSRLREGVPLRLRRANFSPTSVGSHLRQGADSRRRIREGQFLYLRAFARWGPDGA
jgi:hypothetical protein